MLIDIVKRNNVLMLFGLIDRLIDWLEVSEQKQVWQQIAETLEVYKTNFMFTGTVVCAAVADIEALENSQAGVIVEYE